MKTIDIIGAFAAGLIGIAALSLIVAPKSQMAQVVTSLGNAASNLISTAKAFPQ